MPIHVVLLLTGSYLIGSLPGLAVAIVALAAAELAGTLVLPRTGGVRLLERMASDRQERVQATFDRWRGRLGGRDVAVITVLRLIPFVRMGTTVGTGLLGIRLRDFVIGAGISAVIWTAIPLSIGYAFRSNVTTIEGYYQSILDALPMTLGIASLIVVISVLGRSAATTELVKVAQSLPYNRQRADDAETANQIVRDQRPCPCQVATATQSREATAGGERVSGFHLGPHLV
ncbi:MAG: associated Golgi protein-related protein [Thermomicrobiales bacterium]|nr:associated Golgi protein-related protein [Thermomicrobiales bacterium]